MVLTTWTCTPALPYSSMRSSASQQLEAISLKNRSSRIMLANPGRGHLQMDESPVANFSDHLGMTRGKMCVWLSILSMAGRFCGIQDT